jgi:hypothetical protein
MPSHLSNSELAYLDGILIASAIVVIVEGEINYRLRTGDDLPDGREIVVVGIRYFYLLRGIGRATGRERLAGCREALKSTVIRQARHVPRLKLTAPKHPGLHSLMKIVISDTSPVGSREISLKRVFRISKRVYPVWSISISKVARVERY